MMVTVRLMSHALLELLRAGWEADHKESLGYLFGHTVKKDGLMYVVESIHPAQRAERKPTSVTTFDKYDHRCQWTIGNIEQFIGYYHTHHRYWNSNGHQRAAARLSDFDLQEFFKDAPDEIELVLSMNRVHAYRRPRVTENEISGTLLFTDKVRRRGKVNLVPKNYLVTVAGYYWERSTGKRGRVRRALLSLDDVLLDDVFKNPRDKGA